ncbi:MAG: OmpH family outer membrane protein [Planctomycetota bacterium]|nr:MAG: OmpH family outer membrane protein [Planctomycetota bacterium]
MAAAAYTAGMSTQRTFAGIFVAAIAGAMVTAASYNAGASARMAPAPTRVATVDLVKVIERLNERSDWEVQITALGKKIQDEFTAKRKGVEEMARSMEGAANDQERMAIRDKLAFEQLQTEQWEKIKKIEVDRERALMWQSMYRNVRAESQKLADADGWDVIMVNDGVTDIQLQRDSKTPLEAQAQEQIVRRRVLFAAKSTDVTDQLVVRMNNARGTANKPTTSDATAPVPAPAAPAAKPAAK